MRTAIAHNSLELRVVVEAVLRLPGEGEGVEVPQLELDRGFAGDGELPGHVGAIVHRRGAPDAFD